MTAEAIHSGVASKEDIANIRAEISQLETRLTHRMIVLQAFTIGILTFVIKFT